MRIVVDKLACRRSGRVVFEGVSFALGAGEALLVTGRNGAGKSSLLALVANRLRPEAGAVRAEGIGERTLPECLHLVGHRDGLKPALTAEENLAFARDILGEPALPPEEALDTVGLRHAASLPVGYLSAGQRRRVALARLLVARRPLWLLDEPTASLDTAAQEALLGLLRDHLDGGGLAMIATHTPLALPGAMELRLDTEIPSPSPGGARVGVAGAKRGDHLGKPPGALAVNRGTERSATHAPPRPAERSAFSALLLRDLKLAARIGGSGALGLVFFLMLVALLPFALGPDLNLLARIGPALLWLAAVLATLIGLDRLFQADEEDGSLDLMTTTPLPLELVVLAKVAAHWLATGLPLALAAPVFGLLLALTPRAMLATVVTLIAGTPALTFIGAAGAALTSSIRRGGLILAILVLPLMIPTLIFGVAAATAASGGTAAFTTPFLFLTALSLLSGVIATVGTAAALRAAAG